MVRNEYDAHRHLSTSKAHTVRPLKPAPKPRPVRTVLCWMGWLVLIAAVSHYALRAVA